jgi:hypothetical protein
VAQSPHGDIISPSAVNLLERWDIIPSILVAFGPFGWVREKVSSVDARALGSFLTTRKVESKQGCLYGPEYTHKRCPSQGQGQ